MNQGGTTKPKLPDNYRSKNMKQNSKKGIIAFLAATAALAVNAMAVPVSIEDLVTDVSAQATSVITEALPFIAVVVGGTILFKLIRKFVH